MTQESSNISTASAWPADKVERRPLAGLVPYARNARTHSPSQVAQIAASIREWGWTTPVLVDEAGSIIAGHGRVLAAASLGLVDIPVMVANGWSAEQKQAYALADNKLALNADWDNDLLRVELKELQNLNFDMSLVGFNQVELDAVLANLDPDTKTIDEWQGMPEFEHERVHFRAIMVNFDDQAAVDAFAKAIGQEISAKAKTLWYPHKDKQVLVDKRYSAESDESAVPDLYRFEGPASEPADEQSLRSDGSAV